MNKEWESIGDDLLEESGCGELVCVTKDGDYISEMAEQNRKVLNYLQEKYPERTFRLSKWHSHDFGRYQEVEECIEYTNEDEEYDN